ncbi:Yip1 family protein [Streptomyces sp. SID3343]|uniref:YIP1 family protein n=1 Tax=Streptomyces sp. SID3343 TaxID=2690260 RepID=UPI0013719E52|nr:YIP1 family protein [Streptomyces sp. SID3343]
MTGNGPYDPYRQQPPPAGQGYPPQQGGAYGNQYGGQPGYGQPVPPPPSHGYGQQVPPPPPQGYGQQGPPPPQGGQGGSGGPGGSGGSGGDQSYGPLSLPDETSIYVYGAPPEEYTSVTPAVPPQPYRQQAPPQYNAPPPRYLHWKEILSGLVVRPLRTMDEVRDQAAWWPALIMSAIGGVLALLANDASRKEIVDSTLGTSVPALGMVIVMVPAFCALLGLVSHALATQFGGNGSPMPFITLSMLVVWIADAPRLLVAMFAPDDNPIVAGIGIASFVLTAWLLTALMIRVHELPWPRALGCVAVELIALLLVLKLPLTS